MTGSIDPIAAAEFIQNNAEKMAKAKAERIYVSEYKDSLKAILMKEINGDSSIAQQSREALADERYLNILKALKEAVVVEETLRWKFVSAQAKIEVWRSMEASNRAEARL
jgi:hypothetical protein